LFASVQLQHRHDEIEDLLVVKPDENSSGLQAIEANPSKPSVDAMLTLLDKLRVIEATGVLGVDLLWLNGNYQRAPFPRRLHLSWVSFAIGEINSNRPPQDGDRDVDKDEHQVRDDVNAHRSLLKSFWGRTDSSSSTIEIRRGWGTLRT